MAFDVDEYRARLDRALGLGSVPGAEPVTEEGGGPSVGGDDEGEGAPQSATLDGAGHPPSVMFGNTGQGAGPSISPVFRSREQGLAPRAVQAPTAPQAQLAPTAPTAPTAPNAPVALTAGNQQQPGGGAPLPGPSAGVGDGSTGTEADLSDASKRMPANEHTNGEKTPNGSKGIDIHPPDFNPTDPKNYKPGSLEKLQADNPQTPPPASKFFDALTKGNQSKYMDWWEQQHGEIETRYSQLQSEIGHRPDPEAAPTTKDKFKMLLDFGVSLMQGSARGADQGAAVGNAMRTAVSNQQQRQAGRVADYDKQAAVIAAAKQNDLKDLGNYGQAVREDALIQNAQVRTAQAEAKMLAPPKPGQPVTRVLSDGKTQAQWNPQTGKWETSLDQNGKPIQLAPGQMGGRGGTTKDPRTANQKNIDDLIARGVPAETAIANTYHVKPSSDPRKTFTSVYNAELKANGGDSGAAADQAQKITDHLHGQGAIDRASAHDNSTILPTKTPPLEAFKGHGPGDIIHFKNGTSWKLDGNNNPVQVK